VEYSLQDRAGTLDAPVVARLYKGRVARIHRDGDPLEYPHLSAPANRQLRDEAGLQEIADQLQAPKPWVLLHPPDLISRGAKADVIGYVFGATIDGDCVVANFLALDPRADQAIADGVHELSPGYLSQLDARGYQRHIIVDHVALVPQGRCGPTCALRADCSGQIHCPCTSNLLGYNTGVVAEKPVQDGATQPPTGAVQVDNNKGIMDELQKQLAAALADAAKWKAQADQFEGELRTARAAIMSAEVATTNAQAALAAEKKLTAEAAQRAEQAVADAKHRAEQARLDAAAAVTESVKLLTEANRVLGDKDADGKPIDRTSMDDNQIRRAVIKHVDGLEFPPEKDPLFIAGVYTASLARFDAAAQSRADVRQALHQNRTAAVEASRAGGSPVLNADGATEDMETRERNAMIARTRR